MDYSEVELDEKIDGNYTPQLNGICCAMCKKPNSVFISGHEVSHIRVRSVRIRKIKRIVCEACKEIL